MGSLFGGGSAAKAAKAQAAATDRQTELQSQNTNYQVEAMANQMTTAAAQQAATEYADKLLGTPVDTVDVTLGTSDLDVKTNDLIGRRTSSRQTYQRIVPTAQSRLTNIAASNTLL